MRALAALLILFCPTAAWSMGICSGMPPQWGLECGVPVTVTTFPSAPAGGGGGGDPPVAGVCTDGVDCLCDTLTTTSPLVACQDFENVDLYENTAHSWIAGAVNQSLWDRGSQSRWSLDYGFSSGIWKYSDGVPTLGQRCGFGSGAPGVGSNYQGCSGGREWCSAAQGALTTAGGADCWGPTPPDGPLIDIQRAGDADAEVATLTLTGGTGAAADVLGGNQHFAYRIPAGNNAGVVGGNWLKLGGTIGTSQNNTDLTEVGLTMKLAYSSNIGTETDSVIDDAWKHNEWGTDGQGYMEHWNLGNTGCGGDTGTPVSEFPYRPFLWTVSQAACSTALASATKVVGNMDCTGAPALRLCSTTAYHQPTDFPFGTVACHRAHISGLGTNNVTIKVWHNSTLVIHLTGFDGASALRNGYYSNYWWNAYANVNQTSLPSETDVTQYRYEDDVVIVNGPPEPCSAIGL